MATVKGDVHDIGKNIVGVVLGCNNYEVIDLGVMVPTEKILATAVEEKADLVGLSGLITPSLDEMVHVAKEMERRGMDLPLLIGGATTSPQHTAVKIAPEYGHTTVHVLDASRAVGVVSALLDPRQRKALDESRRADQQRLRDLHAARSEKPLLSYEAARANRLALPWAETDLPRAPFLGVRAVDDVSLDRLAKYIDWTFFFTAWELKGRVPQIFEHPRYGDEAKRLYDQANALLADIIAQGSLRASGVYGFWPANSDGDDIVLYQDEARAQELVRFNMLRQQSVMPDDKPNRSLADFIAPRGEGRDYLGAFAVTAGLGADELAKQFEASHDDFNAIMVKLLADRLAEAFAEYLHERARHEWYAPDETLSNDDLTAEKYRGIRPAFGYPACPDHSEKRQLFDLLDAEAHGITLTESYAMWPAASVSGLYFANPASRYFMVGRVGQDQVKAYARRKGITVEDAERWLTPNLAYEVAAVC
jgi:5-methyltetrahydrofolate--homocysteine methyltransferase